MKEIKNKEIKNKEIKIVENNKKIKRKIKNKQEIINILLLLLAFFIGISTVILEKQLNLEGNLDVNSMYLAISGFIMAIGIVVPGVSSTIILMIFGVYNIYLDSVAIMNLYILIPMGIGVLIGCIIWMKITKKLLDKYYTKTFFVIIGFTLGSIFVLFPEINNLTDLILCSLYAATSFCFLRLLEK